MKVSLTALHFEGGKAENFPLTIGSGSFIPGFRGAADRHRLWAKRSEVNVTFPEEYHAKELAGKPAVFKCKVNSIKTKELPELDDEFASEVSDFETLEEYKADIRREAARAEGEGRKDDEGGQGWIEKAVEDADDGYPGG